MLYNPRENRSGPSTLVTVSLLKTHYYTYSPSISYIRLFLPSGFGQSSIDRHSIMASHEMHLDPKYDNYDYPTTSLNTGSGHPGHTSQEQEAALSKLRAELIQAGYSERLDTLSLVCEYVGEWNREAVLILLATIPTRPKIRCRKGEADVRKS